MQKRPRGERPGSDEDRTPACGTDPERTLLHCGFLVQLDHWGTIAETRSLGSGEALQGYSVFLGISSQIRSGPFLLTCVVKRFGWGEAGRDMISSITEVKSYLHGNTALLYTLNLSST